METNIIIKSAYDERIQKANNYIEKIKKYL